MKSFYYEFFYFCRFTSHFHFFQVALKEKNDAADAVLKVLSVENEKVAHEQSIASEEEARVKIIEEDVAVKAKICAEDLKKAEPALIAAQEALNTLNKNNLTELKSFGSPPEAVVNVCGAVMVLFTPKGKPIPKDRSWKAAKIMMGKVDEFLNHLIYYDKENMSVEVVKETQKYCKDPDFVPEKVLKGFKLLQTIIYHLLDFSKVTGCCWSLFMGN